MSRVKRLLTGALVSLYKPLAMSVLAGFFAAGPLVAQERDELDGISIQGNNEQPQVLYLIPWQAPSIPAREEHPPVRTLQNALQPVNPEFHEKELYFRKTQTLHSNLQRKTQ